jgi:hypothetical protein
MGYPGYIPVYRDEDKTNLKWANIKPWKEYSVKVTHELLEELFEYREGDLIWKKGGWKGHKTGLNVKIDGRSYLRSHLVWILFKHEKPKRLRHINGDKSDTRIENLRKWDYHTDHPMAKSINKVRGVYKRGKKYLAYAYKEGKQRLLGSFDNIRAAYDSRKMFFILHFQYWADRFPGGQIMKKEKYSYYKSEPNRQRKAWLRESKNNVLEHTWPEFTNDKQEIVEVLEDYGTHSIVRMKPI